MSAADTATARRARLELLGNLIWRDLTLRYRGTVLSFAWPALTAILVLAVYTVVFTSVFKPRFWSGGAPELFALHLFGGLIPFWVVTEVMNRAPNAVLAVPNYVRKAIFPVHLLAPALVGAALLPSLIAVVILAVAALWGLNVGSAFLWTLPLAYVPLALLGLALAWLLAALGVYLRDLSHAMAVLSQVLLFGSPVLYPLEAAPDWMQTPLQFNPMTHIIACFRWSLVGGPMPNWTGYVIVCAVLAVLAWLAYRLFDRLRGGFADQL